jgi:hypothetical protein
MANCEGSFKYNADASKAPITEVVLDFSCPVFAYPDPTENQRGFLRQTSAWSDTEVALALSANHYEVEVPTKNITGPDDKTVRNFLAYTIQSASNDPTSIENLTVTIDVHFSDANSAEIHRETLRAIYVIRDFEQLFGQGGFDGASRIVLTTNLQPFLEKNLFLINADAYEEMLADFKSLSGSGLNFSLLNALHRLLSFADIVPGKPPRLNDAAINALPEILRIDHIENQDEIITLIGKGFERLFQFPLVLEEIKAITVAGTFHVATADGSDITKDDLTFYELSVEFSTVDGTGVSQPHLLRLDWRQNHHPITTNTIAFDFIETTPILLTGVEGRIDVRVKGFDSSLLWMKDFAPEDPALADLTIEVDLLRPNRLNPGTGIPPGRQGAKLRGQLVALNKKCPLKDAVIAIRAKTAEDSPWQVVGAAVADNSGNFSMPYPFGVFTAAEAIVSLTPDSPAGIPILPDTGDDRTISDDFLYLLVQNPQCDELKNKEDCDCHDAKKPGRLPNQEDLMRSDEYTQDIGGSCINLSTPNRTLREYSYQGIVRTSDPDVANYVLNRTEDDRFELLTDNKKIKRNPVDLDNPIRWQDAPGAHKNLSIYQSVTVATGHILHYRSEFKADGYSLGDLLYSLALAPGQKKEIVVMESAHSLQGAESQTISQGERLAAGIVDDRAIADQLAGGIDENLRGSSSASTAGVSAGLGVGASLGVVSGALGVAGGYANSNSSASQNSSRNTSQFFGEKLRQSIMQNADSYRQLNASVVTTVQENQRYAVTTDVVANHNHCHSLTMMYFEVLRHFAIFQELTDVEECVFVPLLMTNFTRENIFKWADVLARNLLPLHSNTYLQRLNVFSLFGAQHPLLKAFDANERILTSYANVDFPLGPYDREPINFIKGEIVIKTNLPRPKTRYDRIKSLPVTKKTVTHNEFDAGTAAKSVAGAILTGGISLLLGGGSTTRSVSEEVLANAAIFDAFLQLDANFETVPPSQCIRVTTFQPTTVSAGGGTVSISGTNFFEGSIIDKNLWINYATVLGYSDVYAMLDYYFKGRLIAEWDDIFNNDIAPILFERLVDTIHVDLINADYSTTARYKGGERQMRIRLRGTTSKTRFEFPLIIRLFSTGTVFQAMKDSITVDIQNVTIQYSTSHYNGTLFSGYVGDDLLDGTDLPIPESVDEKRDPRKEDIYLVKKLIEHLNSNLEHYNKSLWRNLDTDRRYMLIDGFNIQIFNDFGVPVGMRSLASVVKNQLMAIVGNSLVFPVAAGYKISQSYIKEQTEEGSAVEVTLFDHYKPLTPVPPYRISIPSKGVFLEAVQGYCDACEKVKDNSAQDWTKFGTDEPTPINAVTTPVPTITDWKAAFKDFSPPLINIQNAPVLPAPGAGLAGLNDLLGKAGIFKDITGLDANQQNAIKTFLSDQENAKAFAEMAKGMATQGHNTENSDKIMDTLKSAKDSGALTQQEYGKLVKDHIQQQIDGGDTKKADQVKEQASKSTLTDAAVRAADQGKEVKAQKTNKDGTVESVEIKAGQSESVLGSVQGAVPHLKQENELACWATAATIMMSWKRATTLTVLEALAEAGDKFVQLFKDKKSLLSKDKGEFIAALNMVGEPPANYPLQQYVDWLNKFGPLWITTDSSSAAGVFSPHARILTKITGRGTADGAGTNCVFVDPATGSEVTESFLNFIKAFEQMVSDNPSDLFIQVVHFADDAAPGEGASGPVNISDQFLNTVINAPANQFKTSSEINDFFIAKTGFEFIVFFANKIGGRASWGGITIPTDELSSIRFMNLWDNVVATMGLTSVNLAQFLCLQSAILNETGGRMDIPSEGVGIPNFPGLKYTYSAIPKHVPPGWVKPYVGKGSYNASPLNKLAFELFNDGNFIAAHGARTNAAGHKNTTDAKWKTSVYPLIETSPLKEGFVAQADFHKYRGRGYIQTTWRGNYLPIIEFILTYTGTNAVILKHQTSWITGLPKPVGLLTPSELEGLKQKVATITSNEDWDELFQTSDFIIPLFAITAHDSAKKLKAFKTDTAANCKASILAYGASLNGAVYSQLLLSRVMAILNELGNK